MRPWITGIVLGLVGGLLALLGNPENMGICVACFERDIAGALGLHRALPVQYFRPEIAGLVLGAFIAAVAGKEFAAKGVSAPVSRLMLGFFGMIGALVFLGCPWRAFLRLAGGDLNALVGITGLVAGISIAFRFNKNGFSFEKAGPAPWHEGILFPLLVFAVTCIYLLHPSFGEGKAFFASVSGPGSMSAPFMISIGAALVVGYFGFKSRFCSIAAFRNAIFFRDRSFLVGVIAMIVAAFAVKTISLGISDNSFITFGFKNMPVSHSNHLWNFLGLLLAGMCFSLGEGCPGRQLFKAGGGDLNSVLVITGMFIGAAFAHNFGLAAVPDKIVDGITVIGGPSAAGMLAVGIGITYCLFLGYTRSRTINN